MYKKRPGTSSVRGHLYETKLLSLIQFRARHDERIEEFKLATNVDNIGAFDDICFRAKVKGLDREIAVFVQAKHKERDQVFTLSNTKLTKYFESYLRIERTFEQDKKEPLFEGLSKNVDCLLVLYTNAGSDGGTDKQGQKSDTVKFVNELISTGDPAYQKVYIENVELLSKITLKHDVISLAAQVASYVCGEINEQALSHNELVSRYHVLLGKVFYIVRTLGPDGHKKHILREHFAPSCLTDNDEHVQLFKDAFCLEILKKQKVDRDTYMLHLLFFLTSPDVESLSYLIGGVITFGKGKLKFIDSRVFSDEMKKSLDLVNVSDVTVNEAIHRGAARVLASCELAVPPWFGNCDLSIRGHENKVKKRLKHLVSRLRHYIDQAKPSHIVTIDESEQGILNRNGGLGGAVGNILVYDTDTKLLKCTENSEGLEDQAKMFFEMLTIGIEDLHKYRFDIKSNTFPKLTFDCSDRDKATAKDFLSKLVFLTDQADEDGVEQTLKEEIEQQCPVVSNLKVRSEAIFLKFHNETQKWWKTTGMTSYLTKDTEMCPDDIRTIVKDPLISIMHMICNNKRSHFDYTFNDEAVISLGLQGQTTSVLVTSSVILTASKVTQHLKTRQHAVIDLKHVSYLTTDDCHSLCDEMEANNEIILVLLCDSAKYSRHWCKVLDKVARAVRDKHTIVVAHKNSEAFVKQYFTETSDVVYDHNCLIDMTERSQDNVLENATVSFQGQQMNLKTIVDENSRSLIQGDVLNKIIGEETLVVGKPVGNASYDEIQHLYVNRKVCRGRFRPKLYRDLHIKDSYITIKTLYDVSDDVVLVTAKPGMGKSTLLTHLSLKTKELDPNVWIVRINLLQHSKQFHEWQEKKVVIDTLEVMKFMCQIILSDRSRKTNKIDIFLENNNGVVQLKDSLADEFTTFELKLFLSFYNTNKIIFLFDGFDEICPHYMREVLNLLKTVRSLPAKQKLWVASRSYNIIKSILQKEFGTAYEIQPFCSYKREEYLTKFWNSNLVLKDLNNTQLNNIYEFIKVIWNMKTSSVVSPGPKNKLQFIPLYLIYFSAMQHIKRTVSYTHIPNWSFIFPLDQRQDLGLTRILLQCNGDDKDTNDMLKFMSTPLHLYLIADYFQNEIKDIHFTNKWNLDFHIFSIYERFLETKLKRIRFQEKNNMDIYNPDIISTYEKERKDFIEKHKKIAAYTMFHRSNHSLFTREQLKEIKETLRLIKNGGEKTGVIYSVKNNKPIFIHMTFAEYFAVEYICDLLKHEKRTEQMIKFIFEIIFDESPTNVLNILDSKIKMDDELITIFKDNDKMIYDILFEQSKGYTEQEFDEWSDIFYKVKKFDSAFKRAVCDNLSNFVEFFCTIHNKYLSETNIETFIDFVHDTKLTTIALDATCDNFLHFAKNVVRKIKKKGI
ncbi:unnamed protein product [Chrysodeixis includens]|uniref:NACHT domain-containing protein n=1 Tax=Chrysodeixis includens TaxID=689277 RepID=A0A9P0C0K9_CHRIL|nr:unnamed protein product [Chrysodeixis includens]